MSNALKSLVEIAKAWRKIRKMVPVVQKKLMIVFNDALLNNETSKG